MVWALYVTVIATIPNINNAWLKCVAHASRGRWNTTLRRAHTFWKQILALSPEIFICKIILYTRALTLRGGIILIGSIPSQYSAGRVTSV